jgi:3-oxoacyl-[acyl-carrier protein] reductase
MNLGIESRVAMVAAGSKGLGLATAIALAKEGASVSICARGREALDAAAAEIAEAGTHAKVRAVACDVTKPEQLRAWHERTVMELGAVDILVTNTGGPPAGTFVEIDEAKWREGIDLTLMNVVRLCHAVIPSMRERKWGRIVHITSLVAKQPTELLTVSSTLRAGLSGLTKTLATQLAPEGITVNALLPGHVLTDRQRHLNEVRAKARGGTAEEMQAEQVKHIPIGRFGRPEEIGETIAFLCSERAAYITGVSLQVDGGVISSTF